MPLYLYVLIRIATWIFWAGLAAVVLWLTVGCEILDEYQEHFYLESFLSPYSLETDVPDTGTWEVRAAIFQGGPCTTGPLTVESVTTGASWTAEVVGSTDPEYVGPVLVTTVVSSPGADSFRLHLDSDTCPYLEPASVPPGTIRVNAGAQRFPWKVAETRGFTCVSSLGTSVQCDGLYPLYAVRPR